MSSVEHSQASDEALPSMNQQQAVIHFRRFTEQERKDVKRALVQANISSTGGVIDSDGPLEQAIPFTVTRPSHPIISSSEHSAESVSDVRNVLWNCLNTLKGRLPHIMLTIERILPTIRGQCRWMWLPWSDKCQKKILFRDRKHFSELWATLYMIEDEYSRMQRSLLFGPSEVLQELHDRFVGYCTLLPHWESDVESAARQYHCRSFIGDDLA